MGGAPLFNVRMEDDMQEACEDAAAREGLKKSAWAREVLAAVAVGGVTLEELTALVQAKRRGQSIFPHPARFLALQGQTGRQDVAQAACKHPPTAIKILPFSDVCTLCGSSWRRRG